METNQRWRFIAVGAVGHVWHDTIYNRYVVSDQYGPAGSTEQGGRRGVYRPDPNDFRVREEK